MKKYLTAAADGAVWTVTISLIALVVLLLTLAGGITTMPLPLVIILYSIAGIAALVLLIGWLAKPVRYEVRDDSVSIVRTWPFSTIRIPKSEIKEAKYMKLGPIKPASVSVGWVFGYAGRFRSKEHGAFVIFATNPTDAVLIHAAERYILSPANPKRFMNDVLGRK